MGFFNRIFKKVKKVIKKPITKIFKTVGKGIAKIGKNVWNGIKDLGGKAFSAYGKLSKKLGPIGMIGVSMAMPYLLGAFGATGGGLWTGFGKLMGGTGQGFAFPQGVKYGLQASQNPFLKVIGHVGKGVYNSANFVGGTMKGISQTIGATFKGFGNGSISEGFKNLYQGTTEVLTGKAGMGTARLDQFTGLSGVSGGGVFPTTSSYVTQTGGVALGNANIANQFINDSISAALQKDAVFNSMAGDTKKYFNSVKKYIPNIDDGTAYNYVKQNGAFYNPKSMSLEMDFSMSPDFKFNAPPTESASIGANYSFTGSNINKTLDTLKINTNLGTVNKVTGEAFEAEGLEQNNGLLSKKNVTKAAIETVKGFLTSDNNTQQSLIPTSSNNLNVLSGAYDGTNVTASKGGSLIQNVNPELAAAIANSQFNIAGSR
tara:strand:+ start:156 stop:1445 length:1290 start_codon:yes stop_codon:yes gene_type:complete